jgi:hypothetical protein
MSQIGSAATGSSATLDGVVRAFLVQGVRDPVMRERVVLSLEAATTMLAGLLRERSDVDHPDPELAADVVVRTIVGALQQTILLDRSFPRGALYRKAEPSRALLPDRPASGVTGFRPAPADWWRAGPSRRWYLRRKLLNARILALTSS